MPTIGYVVGYLSGYGSANMLREGYRLGYLQKKAEYDLGSALKAGAVTTALATPVVAAGGGAVEAAFAPKGKRLAAFKLGAMRGGKFALIATIPMLLASDLIRKSISGQ